MSSITQFANEYSFLSLDYPFSFTLYDITFKNLAQYYFGFKCNFIEIMRKLTESSLDPEAFINELDEKFIRPDWKQVREQILNHGIYQKFTDPELQNKLLATGDSTLIFGFMNPNPSKDLLYLGKSLVTNEGKNQLGKQLMKTREYFKALKLHTLINSSSEYSSLIDKTE